MNEFSVTFLPHNKTIKVKGRTTLLAAASRLRLTVNNICGGDGICGRCKMIIRKGEVVGDVSNKLTLGEIKKGYVLGCMTVVKTDLVVEIPEETWARTKIDVDEDTERFSHFRKGVIGKGEFETTPIVMKMYLELPKPTLADNQADQQRVCDMVNKKIESIAVQMGLKIIRKLPDLLRDNDYCITATVGLRRDVAEIMNIEGKNTASKNYMVVVDIGTTTIVAHLVDVNTASTLDAKACFNSQGVFGREVTGRIISAEKQGTKQLQKVLQDDINHLINKLAVENTIDLKNITAVVCAGNTVMSHFLLGLPTEYIRRTPYIPTTVEPPPFRAAEVGININPRGLLYSLPGISGWVGSDITAGILATGMHKQDELCLLVDIGTNGEIVVGNKDWLISASASAGPAFEGLNEECGMRAESGAIEKVFVKAGKIVYKTIGNRPPLGICGSGIIDLISVLQLEEIIDRGGKFIRSNSDKIVEVEGELRYILLKGEKTWSNKSVFITESDIANVISAKAAIFAAINILFKRVDLSFSDVKHFYLAGAFGNYINIKNAINIGLVPNIAEEKIHYMGNTSINGAKLAAFFIEAFYEIEEIRKNTTYYDLMGANDYVEEFKKAMFIPHTDIDWFWRK